MKDLRPSCLNDPWKVEGRRGCVSPDVNEDQIEHIVWFAGHLADGSIEATRT
jgi:hypothetical protein